ncbi:MAG: baseplate J/gp47 family protein [Deltaproteobacteria bacterium]|nr:baseplate J/gp47 family protein [Deltaproteobacteria bacterium]
MKDQIIGTTAYNQPHQTSIHYSGKGYDEYRLDLVKRLEANGFTLRDDDFINAFIDLTAYLGNVLMTYQNAYAQEIYLETSQLRESLFNFSMMIDYKIDPGAAAVGKLAVFAKPTKSGLLPKGFQVSGKEENAKKKVFFETNTDLNVDVLYNDFALISSERYNTLDIGTSITITEKLVVKPGEHLYFKDATGHLIGQVQEATIDEAQKTTSISYTSQYFSLSASAKIGDGTWALMNAEEIGLLEVNATEVYLDGKFENISVNDPLIIKENGSDDCFGTVTAIDFEMKEIKISIQRWISDTAAAPGETLRYSYTIDITGGTKTFYALEKDITEVREVTLLTVFWIGGAVLAAYTESPYEKSPNHVVYAGLKKALTVETKEANLTPLNGATQLKVDGDFTALEKYRSLVLHEDISGVGYTEEILVKKVTYKAATKESYIDLKTAISNAFTKYGLKIWGNVVAITQGKTINETVLGSGRGEISYQSFEIPQAPLTYQGQGREGIQGAIDLKVNDLPWTQKNNFLYSKTEDRHFIIETDYAGKSRVVFGDGLNGACLPTGKDNVKAIFRIGQGTEGNVGAKILKKPTSKPPILKEVYNFDNTTGGSDPDTEEELKDKIPVEHLTFDRAVSLSDYADLSLAYPGIGKAKAGWRWINNQKKVYLAVIGEEGDDPSAILQDLRDHLDARRDINQPLLVTPVIDVPIGIIMDVVVLPDYDPDKVKDKILTVLGTDLTSDGSLAFFNFKRLNIGISIHIKDIYRVVEQVIGVKRISRLYAYRISCTDSGMHEPSFCTDDIWIHNWELASLDKTALEINMLQPPVNKICDHLGD